MFISKKIFLLFILALLYIKAKSQFPFQRLFSDYNCESKYFSSSKLSNNELIIAHSDYFTIPFTAIGNPSVLNEMNAIISKLDDDYNVAWSKKINRFLIRKVIVDIDDNVLVLGFDPTSVGANGKVLFKPTIFEFNSIGTLILKKSYGLISGQASTLPSFDADIIQTTDKNYIFSFIDDMLDTDARLGRFVLTKLNSTLDIIYSKEKRIKFDEFLPENNIFFPHFLTALDSSKFTIARKIYPSGGFDKQQLAIFNKNGFNDIMLSFDDSIGISNIIQTQETHKLVIGGEHLSSTSNIIGNTANLNFIMSLDYTDRYGKMNFNLIQTKIKKLSDFNPTGLVSYNNSYYLYPFFEKQNQYNATGFTQNINDSLTNNHRFNIIKYDNNLNLVWNKRMHIDGVTAPANYNLNYPYTTQISNDLFTTSNLYFKNDRIIISGMKSNLLIQKTDSMYSSTVSKSGILVTEMDTSGVKANCELTNIGYIENKFEKNFSFADTISFQKIDLNPITLNFLIENHIYRLIADTCIQPKKPVVRFRWRSFPNRLNDSLGYACINSNIVLEEASYNEPETWHWILPPQIINTILDSSNYPNLKKLKFTTPGTYFISLIVKNNLGSDTLTKIIVIVGNPPKPNLGNDTSLCDGQKFTLFSNAPLGSFPIWYLSSVSLTNIIPRATDSLQITQSGTYILAYSNSCSIRYDTIKIKYIGKPTALFTTNILCSSINGLFTNLSDSNSNISIHYTWKVFNQSNNSLIYTTNTFNLNFNFPNFGSYNIRLIVYAPQCGFYDSITVLIGLAQRPTTNANFIEKCGSLFVQFTSLPNTTFDPPQDFYWYLNGNLIGTGVSPIINLPNYGNHIIKHFFVTRNGCYSDTTTLNVLTRDKPLIVINEKNEYCVNELIQFNPIISISNASTINTNWILPDNAISLTPLTNLISLSTINNPTTISQYKFFVVSNQGCISDTFIKSISVQAFPQANFSVMPSCVNKVLNISNTSTGLITNYFWLFNNDNLNTNILPIFSFPTNGTFEIKLKVITENLCADSISKTVNIQTNPIANFEIVSSCINVPIIINNTSSNIDGAISNYIWTSNNKSSNAISPNFIYNSFSTYPLNLKIETTNGCKDEITKVINIAPVILNTISDTNIVINQTLQLQVSGATSYIWSPKTYLNFTNIPNPMFKPSNYGKFIISVKGTNDLLCSTTKQVNINVYNVKQGLLIPNAFTPNDDGLNDNIKTICIGLKQIIGLNIFNRNGQLIYTSKNCNDKGWDGTYKGEPQPQGNYTYFYNAIDYSNNKIVGKGNILLLR